jgi:hypothetical protein
MPDVCGLGAPWTDKHAGKVLSLQEEGTGLAGSRTCCSQAGSAARVAAADGGSASAPAATAGVPQRSALL